MNEHSITRRQVTRLELFIASRFTHLEKLIMTNAQTLAALQAAVAAEDTVIGSAVTMINGIAAQIAAAGVDPDALAALVTDVQASAASLAAAIQANQAPVPATPAPAPVASSIMVGTGDDVTGDGTAPAATTGSAS